MAKPLFIYLHGFNSSPGSYKAQQFNHWMAAAGRSDDVLIPVLPHWPQRAIQVVEQLIVQYAGRAITLVGSSLGGYYSLYLAEKYRLRAVLVNPAVRPYELLAALLGEQGNYYTDERYILTRKHLEQLLALDCVTLSYPQHYLLLTQTADETLDYREAVDKLADSPQWVQPGGSHAFEQFERLIPAILAFGEGRLELPALTDLTDMTI